MSEHKEKILVLCVDRDNDIGVKAGFVTPIIGKLDNLNAASQLALRDPEESDANAIFGAVQTFDSVSSDLNSENCEIATISGSERGGLTADKNIREQLLKILETFSPSGVILVTDGFGDEAVIPIIQSHVPIMSVKRIVVRHSEAIEESWAVLSRYLRKALEDPYYSRWILGAPGLLLVIMGFLWQFVAFINPGFFFLVIVGALLIIRGFSIDKTLVQFIYPSPPNLIRLFTAIIALIIIGLAFYQTYGILTDRFGSIENWLVILPTVIGVAIRYATDLIVIAFCIVIGGLSVYLYFMRDSRMLWSIIGLVSSILLRGIALKVSEILLLDQTPVPANYLIELSTIVILSIVTTIIIIFVTQRLGKRLDIYFQKEEIET